MDIGQIVSLQNCGLQKKCKEKLILYKYSNAYALNGAGRKPLMSSNIDIEIVPFALIVRVAFLEWLDSRENLKDKNVFKEVISASIDNCGLTPAEIAEEVGYSTSNISRWLRGMNAPHEVSREIIIGRIRGLIERKNIESLKK